MKIVCIGMNYVQHVKELANDVPSEPVFFIKPDTALLRNNDPFYIPHFTEDLQYETELVVRISRIAKSIDERFAHRCYDEVGLGIDFTARDLQRECRAKGLPWEICKGFDHSAAISPEFVPKSELGELQKLNFCLDINGQRRQTGCAADMLFGIDRLIAYVSQYVTFKIGDLLFTGTPAGVGRVAIGDRLEGYLEGRKLLDFEIK